MLLGLEIPSSGSNLFNPYPVNAGIFCVAVYSGKNNYLCWVWNIIHFLMGRIMIHWIGFLLNFFGKSLFPEVPCTLPSNAKVWFLISPFYLWCTFFYKICLLVIHCDVLGYIFIVRHWLTIPIVLLTALGITSISVLFYQFTDHISGKSISVFSCNR